MKKASWLVTAVLPGWSVSGWAQIPTANIVGTVTEFSESHWMSANFLLLRKPRAFYHDSFPSWQSGVGVIEARRV